MADWNSARCWSGMGPLRYFLAWPIASERRLWRTSSMNSWRWIQKSKVLWTRRKRSNDWEKECETKRDERRSSSISSCFRWTRPDIWKHRVASTILRFRVRPNKFPNWPNAKRKDLQRSTSSTEKKSRRRRRRMVSIVCSSLKMKKEKRILCQRTSIPVALASACAVSKQRVRKRKSTRIRS